MMQPKNFLIYHGSPGIGKTYLCAAITSWALANFSSYRFYREEGLLQLLRERISQKKGDYTKELENLIDDDLIVLDDVGSGIDIRHLQRNIEWRSEVFYSFVDYRYRHCKPTIITSNFSYEDFKQIYSQRTISRLFAAENIIIDAIGGVDKRSMGF